MEKKGPGRPRTSFKLTDIKEILSDRKWHSLSEFVRKVGDTIKPELATAALRHTIKNKYQDDFGVSIAHGRRIFIRQRMKTYEHQGLLACKDEPHRETGLEERWYKLAGWFCWACGTPQSEDDASGDHLCKECSADDKENIETESKDTE
jgi:hypothetical protein